MTHTRTRFIISLLCLLAINIQLLYAQPGGCRLKEPLLHIDFGSGENVPEFNATSHANHQRSEENCPPDGFYIYASYTSQCFNNDWFTLHDHSGNDGNMMLVNASPHGGSFFNTILKDLKGNTTYEFAVWMLNVCRINGGCDPLPPNIQVSIISFTGKKVAGFVTGRLVQTDFPRWKKYSAYFTTPPEETMLGLTMSNMTTGGCGNDFAMDDITISECVPPPPPVVKEAPKKLSPPPAVVAKPIPAKTTPVTKTEAQEPAPEISRKKMDTTVLMTSEPVAKKNVSPLPTPKAQKLVTLPPLLVKRENTIVKQLTTEAGEMQVDLYDNGQIDGDTVTIYHNNVLVVSQAGLSEKPISFKITVDEKQPHHELVMVANNLGSIPPNTSLMIVRINGKRYDVFISSSEQQNAKVVIDLSR